MRTFAWVVPLSFLALCGAAPGGLAAEEGASAVDFVVGADAGAPPHLQVFLGDSGELVSSFFAASPAYFGGVRVAAGDVDGDGLDDVVTGTGPGAPSTVHVYSGRTGALLLSFFPYGAGYRGGVYVAAGDIDGDGQADVITGAGPGAGPHVKVFRGTDGATIRSFFAYDPSFLGGVHVAAGDVNGDQTTDIVTAPGRGGSSNVRAFSGSDGEVLLSFLAYPSFTGGVFVAAGDVNGDGLDDVVTGVDAGPPHVKAFSSADGSLLLSFFAYDPAFTGGVRVATGDVDGDGQADVVTCSGPGGAAHVKAFSARTGETLRSFLALPGSTRGGFVATRRTTEGQPPPPTPEAIARYVAGLPADAFDTRGRRAAILARLRVVEVMLHAGREAGPASIVSGLLLHLDGCGASSAGANAGRDDWIVDCEAQQTVRAMLEAMLAAPPR